MGNKYHRIFTVVFLLNAVLIGLMNSFPIDRIRAKIVHLHSQ